MDVTTSWEFDTADDSDYAELEKRIMQLMMGDDEDTSIVESKFSHPTENYQGTPTPLSFPTAIRPFHSDFDRGDYRKHLVATTPNRQPLIPAKGTGVFIPLPITRRVPPGKTNRWRTIYKRRVENTEFIES